MTSDSSGKPFLNEALRIRRLMARFIGGGYLLYFVIALPEIRAGTVVVAAWFTPLAVLIAFGPGWLLVAVAFTQYRSRTATVLPFACGAGYLGALVLWFVAWDGSELDAERGTWLAIFPGLASLALVVSKYPWLAVAHLVIGAPLSLVASGLGRADRYGDVAPLGDFVWVVMFSGVFVGAGIMAVRTGDVLDATRRHATETAAEAAIQQARAAEYELFKGMVHDQVLVVLHNVRAGGNPGLVRYAHDALADLDMTTEGAGNDVDLVALLRTVVAGIRSDITIVASIRGTVGDVPAAVTREIVSAATEAVRNAVRHAGHEASITVEVHRVGESVEVVIVDDGKGFQPRAVRYDRLGLEVSIRRRLAAVRGHATVETAVGSGTRVSLWWSP